MAPITKQLLCEDPETRRLAYRILRMHCELVMAARTENDQLTLAASLVLSGAKEQILVELTRVLGRNVSVADQPLNFAAAILWCLKSVFSATNPFLGAFLLMVLTFGSITGGCYLVYSSLEDSGKSGYGITAKITTALGDGIEAFFLVLFDLIARNRPVIAVTGLSMAGVLRCTGKVFTNNINWSDGGILLEIVGEVGLCLLRWRLLLTEGRWGVNHEWKLVRSDEPVTVAEQAELWTALWEVNYQPEFEAAETLALTQAMP